MVSERLASAALGFWISAQCLALQPASDDELADAAGAGGLSFLVTNPGSLGSAGANAYSSGNTNLYINPNNGRGATSASLEVGGLQVQPIADGGMVSSSGLAQRYSVDMGADSAGAGISLDASWARQRLLGNYLLTLGGDAPTAATGFVTPAVGATGSSQYSFGRMAFDSAGSFSLASSRGLLDTSSIDSNLLLRLTLGPSGGSSQFGAYGTVPGYAQVYYQQNTAAGSPQLVMDNIYMDVGLHPGVGGMIGACTAASVCGLSNNHFASGASGLYLVTPQLDFNFTFNFNDELNPATALQTGTTTNSYLSTPQALTVWGWTGDFSGSGGGSNSGAGLMVGGGGVWANSSGTSYNPDTPGYSNGISRQDGLNIAFHGNYDPSNFTWYIGRPGDVLAFGNWVTIPGAAWSLDAPDITLTMVNAGQGPGGLCWGSSYYSGTGGGCGASYSRPVIPGTTVSVNGEYLETNAASSPAASPNNSGAGSGANTGMALLIRDLKLQAYSTNVQIMDDINQTGSFSGTAIANNGASQSKTITEPWSLIYTLGQLDSNIYLYPGNGAGGNGLTTDILLMTQSFAPGSNSNPLLNNSNFMIGQACDTTSATGNCNIPGSWNGGSAPAWCNPSCTMAVGLTQADLLFAANQLHLNLSSASSNYGSAQALASETFGPGIEFKGADLRDEIQGLFAGGFVQNSSGSLAMNQPGTQTTAALAGENEVVATLVDLNIESNNFDFTVSPQVSSYCYGSLSCASGLPYTFLGLAGHFTFISPGAPNNSSDVGGTAPTASGLDITPTAGGCTTATDHSCDGSYFSLAEPYQPGSDVRLADIQGDVAVLACTSAATCNGTLSSPTPSEIALISAGDPNYSDGKPRLRIAETVAIGSVAASDGEPLSAIFKLDSAAPFPTSGSNSTITPYNSPDAVGTIVIPAAQIYTSVTLRPH